MIIQYAVNRTVKVGRKKTMEHKNGKFTVSGSPKDVGWSQKIRGLINSKAPGWTITGWTEIESPQPGDGMDAALVGNEKSLAKGNPPSEEMMMAFEAGYKACEGGANWQIAKSVFINLWKSL